MSAILKQKLIDIANGFTKYGLWKGGGSGALSEMTDVTLSNLQSNDVLTYNGSVWVNDDNLQKQIDTLNSNLIKCKMIVSTTNGGGGIHIQTASGISLNKVIAITLVGGNLEIYPIILDNGFVVIKKLSGEHYINSEVTLNVWYIN